MGVSREVARVSAIVHGYSVAMAWGAAILLAAAVPIAVLVNAGAPARRVEHRDSFTYLT
jgi:hypothetical protein